MKAFSTRPLHREIGIGAASPLSRVGDGSAGRAVGQSSGLTHWDPVESQCNLTSSGKRTRVSPSRKWLGGGSPKYICKHCGCKTEVKSLATTPKETHEG